MLYYPLNQEESFNFLPSGTNCGLKGIVKKRIIIPIHYQYRQQVQR